MNDATESAIALSCAASQGETPDSSMAFPLPRGITSPEIAFLCEMEMVTVVPRQRLEGLELLGVS